QRRYVETFSAYTRQFLDRLARPDADAIEGIPPAIAIDQSGAVKTSRSTVGTMTGINDYLKVLYARRAAAHCPDCGREGAAEDCASVLAHLEALGAGEFPVLVVAPVPLGGFGASGGAAEIVRASLSSQGFARFLRGGAVLPLERLEDTDCRGE